MGRVSCTVVSDGLLRLGGNICIDVEGVNVTSEGRRHSGSPITVVSLGVAGSVH